MYGSPFQSNSFGLIKEQLKNIINTIEKKKYDGNFI